MKRKHFLLTAATLASGTFIKNTAFASSPSEKKIVIPPYLSQGDTIGITSTSGYITLDKIQPSIDLIKSWGFQIEIGKTIGTRDGTFGGTDAERINEFQNMLDAPHIKAILCARGGYGIVRIIDNIDFSQIRKHPKWIIGFSDVTVLHAHINRTQHVATIHSKMCNSFPDVWETAEPLRKDTILSIKDALMGISMKYQVSKNNSNRLGDAKGELIGGNLRTLENLAGTVSQLDTKGKILFLEEVEEPLYNVDRMFWNLKRTNQLSGLAGLVIGGFKLKPDDIPDDKFGLTLEQIVLEKIKEYDYPVCFDFPVGHQINNFALKCGCQHQLSVTDKDTILSEILI